MQRRGDSRSFFDPLSCGYYMVGSGGGMGNIMSGKSDGPLETIVAVNTATVAGLMMGHRRETQERITQQAAGAKEHPHSRRAKRGLGGDMIIGRVK